MVQSEKKTAILMIGPHKDARGGISSVLRIYDASSLQKTVYFLASYQDGSVLVRLGRFVWFWLNYVLMLIFRPSIRVIHIHMASRGSFLRKSLVLLAAKIGRKKTILHIHGAGFDVFYKTSPGWLQGCIRLVLRSADRLIVLSSQWRENISKISQHPDIRVIYNPTLLKEQLPDNFSSVQQPVRFLFMGRLDHRKGVYDIIRSIRRFEGAPLTVNLYGDGEVERFRQEVNQYGLADKVRVSGWIDGGEKDAAFRNADVLILPSYHEGLPIAVLEAMSYGLPVLTTPVGGIPEAVEDGVNGFLVTPGDYVQLAERMGALAISPDLRRKMGEAGYRMAADKFSLPIIVRQLEGLYAELEN